MYTNQTVFTESVLFLRKQQKRSVNEKGKCVLYGDFNMKCAVGCLIPDEIYSKSMERFGRVESLIGNFLSIAKLFSDVSTILLNELQLIHDTIPIESWESAWLDLAEEFNLEMPK